MLKKIALITSLFSTLSINAVFAQSTPEGDSSDKKLQAIPKEIRDTFKKEDLEAAVKDAIEIKQNMLSSYERALKDKEITEASKSVSRRADDIANEVLAQKRDQILDFLGIDPESSTALYYFVSWSMPLNILRSYALEAMWSGGTLVIKGVPPGKDLAQFFMEDVQQLIYGKGASANISIDPRLFDAYQVEVVPTLVYSTVRDNFQCQGVVRTKIEHPTQELFYDRCPPLETNSYYKISGAVTTSYALEQFKEKGAPGVDSHLSALSKGFATGEKPGKEITAFAGEWKDAITPEDRKNIQEALDLFKAKQDAEKSSP